MPSRMMGYDPITGVPTAGTEDVTPGMPPPPYLGTPTVPPSAVPTPGPARGNYSILGGSYTGADTPPPSDAPAAGWNTEMPSAMSPAPAPASGGTFDGSLASVQSALTAAGWPSSESADYWAGRIAATGGNTPDNLAFWEDKIAKGPNGQTPDTPAAPSGTDPLSPLLASGHTAFGGDVETILKNIISQGGLTPDISGSLINARENEVGAEQGQLSDAEAQLAATGGMSEPGVAQGPTTSAIERIQSNVGPAYAGAVRDISTNALNTQNANMLSALQAATGMSEADANTILNSVGTGTQRQVALAGIALDQLKESDSWNQFLATYGLDQAKLQNDINNGNWDHVISLLTLYTQGGQTAAGGFF